MASTPEKPSTIEVEVNHPRLAFIYRFFMPTITINGRKERRPWGVHSFMVAPGDYEITLSYPWLFSAECGKNSIHVSVALGERKKVCYRAGHVRYLPGTITVSS